MADFVGIYMQYDAAREQASVAEEWGRYNARVKELEAIQTAKATAFAATRAREEAEYFRGRQKVGLANTGVMMTEGSPLLLAADTFAKQEMDIAIGQREGLIASQRQNQESKVIRVQAKQQAQAIKTGATATAFTQTNDSVNSYMSLLGGFSG